jgi:methylglyoxal synthase
VQVALIAHDDKKDTMVAWARDHADFLGAHDLIATGTTGGRLNDETPLSVTRMESGTLGGDLQIGAAVVTGDCDAVVFFRDPMTAQPHEPDISALMRICDVRGVPLATNRATATAMVVGIASLAED